MFQSSPSQSSRMRRLLTTVTASALTVGGLVAAGGAAQAASTMNVCTPGTLGDKTFTHCEQYLFGYQRENQTFTVPEDVHEITVQMWGAGGGGVRQDTIAETASGGAGGFTEATLTVTPGTTYTMMIGEGGRAGGSADMGMGLGSNYVTWGNGGKGGISLDPSRALHMSGGSGGGMSAMFVGDDLHEGSAILIAGGGGGSAAGNAVTDSVPGGGGGEVGGSSLNLDTSGAGATQQNGGAAALAPEMCAAGQAGTFLYGGNGFDATTGTTKTAGGGGGGGGWYGGGGGKCNTGTSAATYNSGGGGGGVGHVANSEMVLSSRMMNGEDGSISGVATTPYTEGIDNRPSYQMNNGASTTFAGNGGEISNGPLIAGGDGAILIQWVDQRIPDAPIVTSVTEGTVSGTAEANSTVVVKNGDTIVCTTTADENGDFTCALNPAAKRGDTLSVTSTTPTGNTSDATTVTVGLQDAKDEALADIDQAAKDGKDAIDALENLTEEEKQAAKDAIDSESDKAKDEINSAGSLGEVEDSKTSGTDTINSLADSSELQDAKNAAKKALDNKAKDSKDAIDALGNASEEDKTAAKEAIDKARDAAKDAVDKADTAPAVEIERQDGFDEMDKILDTLTNQDQNAVADAKKGAKDDIDQAAKDGKGAIDKLTNLTEEEKQAAKDAIDSEADKAKDAIDAADKVEDIASAKTAGKDSIGKIVTDSTLQDAKNAAKTALDNKAKDLKDSIDKLVDVSAEDRAAAKKEIDKARDAAKNQVDAADTAPAVEIERQDGFDEMDKILDTLTNQAQGSLTEAKNKAKGDIDQAAKDAKDAIDKLTDLSAKEKTAAKNLVDSETNKAKDAIDKATKAEDITSAKTAGKNSIGKIVTDATLQDAKNAAKKALDNKAIDAKNKIDKLVNVSDAAKAAAKKEIDKARDTAKTAVDKADTVAKVKSARDAGIRAIDAVRMPAATAITTTRYAGKDRYATSLDLNRRTMSTGKPVFVATGDTFVDALSVSPAVRVHDGALVLTPQGKMSADMLALLKDKKPSQVYVVGGTNSVSKAVEKQLTDAFGLSAVKRVDGKDRYETSSKIFAKFFEGRQVKSALIATGTSFPDALSAAAAGGAMTSPVLLARSGSGTLDASMMTLLNSHKVSDLHIVGGNKSVSAKLETALKGKFTVTRSQGTDRYATNMAVNALLDKQFPQTKVQGVWVTTGVSYPDALSASVPAGYSNQRLVLSAGTCLSAPVVSNWINGANSAVNKVSLVGGEKSLAKGLDTVLTQCK